MSKMSLIVLRLLTVAIAIGLVACGGQPTKSDDEVSVEQKQDISVAVTKPAEAAPESETKIDQEPPAIELIPRKDLEKPKIAMEPLPTDEVVEVPVIEQDKPREGSPEGSAESESAVKAEVVKEQADQSGPVAVTPMEPAADNKLDTGQVKPGPDDLANLGAPVESQTITAKVPVQKETAATMAPAEEPADPYTFIVTVGPKTAPHPSLGKGHVMGFLINGVSGKQLVLERGKTYTFEIRTDPKHDVYLSNKEIGWGSSPITEGVTGAYTYKGKMVFTPNNLTPDNVYYACRNHPFMGALIQVVNPGEKVRAVVATTSTSSMAGASATTSTPSKIMEVSAAKVKQKLMFAEMMAGSQSAKRVNASQNDEAKQLLTDAKILLQEGRQQSLVGALPEALALADKSLKMMSEASRLVPGEEELAQLAENYKSSLSEIHGYQKSHKANLKRLEKAGVIPEGARYDEARVAKKLSDAQGMADKKNYVHANAILGEVQKEITVALHKMLDSSTIIYDLKFDTAADEYEYELKRFTGYEELIPVAIEAKKPAPGAIKLMESFHEKARKRRDQAVAKAATGEYGDAIAMLQQATTTVRRALRMVGVMQ